jgi:putative alpha-1,2-mannosidase
LDWNSTRNKGYISAGDESESVSKTLEYAYDDWCIARMAEAMGKDSLATVFYKRSENWKNLFDPETGFFRARVNNGWFSPLNPKK